MTMAARDAGEEGGFGFGLGGEVIAADIDYSQTEHDRPPELPSLSPGEWLRTNLFSNALNSVLTVLASLFALFALRGLLNFVFSEERNWAGVRTNLRLLFTQAYPEEQYSRIWVTVGALMIMAGFTAGVWARWGSVPVKRVLTWVMTLGGLIAACVVLREPSVLTDSQGEPLLDTSRAVIRQSYFDAMSDRLEWWVAAVVLFGAGLAVWLKLGDAQRRHRLVPVWSLFGIGSGLMVLSLWLVRYGHYAFSDGEFIAEPGQRVAATTRIPWTVMWLLLAAAYTLGRRLRAGDPERKTLRLLVNLGWLASPFVLYWLVLRDPDFEYAHVFSTDIPLAAAFAAAGGAILWWLAKPDRGEIGRVVATLLLVPVAVSWLGALFGWFPMLQKARISLVLLVLAAMLAPTFAGENAKRRRFVTAWVLLIGVTHYLITAINSDSTVDTPTHEFIGGFSVTLLVATLTLLLSFPFGVLLALARTSKLPLFRVMATTYIEVIRGVPLITILFFFAVVLNLFLPAGIEINLLAAAVLGFTLFSAAYLAENIRGGLQAVRVAQREAADALGLTSTQRTMFIILPQALRVSIPPLVGQVIATFKETSLLAIVGLFDFLRIANSVIPAQSEFLGVKREGLLFVSAFYWVCAFSMSKYSQRLERRLGVGER
ncbi:MAG TPA: hypothetical protein DEP66_06265 [Acidimicrobiaceae bacterium]|nr:hypothetical protein [Acidimicrobiaceae bacterium]HCB37793.1 hypothetical protein [Acidimicrobiaceae bacterium]